MLQNIYKYGWLTVMALALLIGFNACSDDDDQGGGAPVIDYVRVTAPEKADSTFTQAFPGQMIVIVGKNLAGAKELYINDQSLTFNPNMNTNQNIIVSIPTEENGFGLTVWNQDLKAEIRVVTPGGTATYSFKVLSPSPVIDRIAGRYPREAGDELKIYGDNFLDIERVYFTDVNPYPEDGTGEFVTGGTEVNVTQYSLKQDRKMDTKLKKYVTKSVMTMTLPELSYGKGYLVIVCPQGTTAIDYAALPPNPIVKQLSSDMPIKGQKVTVHGSYFIDVESVKFGDIVIPAEDLTVAESEDELSFIMPAQKPDASTRLTVVTPGGEASVPFYQYECVLIDFDTRGKDMGWDPNATYQVADGTKVPFTSDGKFGLIEGTDNGWNWWGTMIYWQPKDTETFTLPSYSIIPQTTSADKVYLAYECYNTKAFNTSCFMHYRFETQNAGEVAYENFDWGTGRPYDVVYPNYEGDPELNTWYTVYIPMNKFGAFAGKKYKDIVDANITTVRLMEQNWGGDVQPLHLCIDNIRIVTK